MDSNQRPSGLQVWMFQHRGQRTASLRFVISGKICLTKTSPRRNRDLVGFSFFYLAHIKNKKIILFPPKISLITGTQVTARLN